MWKCYVAEVCLVARQLREQVNAQLGAEAHRFLIFIVLRGSY
jgi:hypothetical protein